MATIKFQGWAPYLLSPSLAQYKAFSQMFGSGLSALGWTLAGTTGEVNWSNVIAAPTSALINSGGARNWRGAWASGTSYAVGDVVTDGGLSWWCLTAEAALYVTTGVTNSAGTSTLAGTFAGAGSNAWAGLAITVAGFVTTPANNGTFVVLTSSTTQLTYANASGVTETHASTAVIQTGPGTLHGGTNFDSIGSTYHWVAYNYEIWKSTGPLSLGNGLGTIYLFLQYYITSVGRMDVFFSVATSCDSNGVFSGNQTQSGQFQALLTASTNGAAGILYEFDFCGDGDNVSLICLRDLSTGAGILVIDRARDASGTANGTYTFVMKAAQAATAQLLFAQGSGPATAQMTTWPTIVSGLSSSSWQGGMAALPIFPLPGYVANPTIGAICMNSNDFQDGALVGVVLYGTVHTFLMTTNISGSAIATGLKAGIRWEVF